MDKIRVDGSHGLRFPLRRAKGYFIPGSTSFHPGSLALSTSESLLRAPKFINPNKAVFTIDSKTSQILIVNNNACQLLGYSSRELCSMQFLELLTSKNKSHVCALAETQLNSEDGTMVLLSGKVVEMTAKQGVKVAVSLWVRQIDAEGRCLAVAEPVERRMCQLHVDQLGYITSVDPESLIIFQYENIEQLIGIDIYNLIPAIKLPDPESGTISKNIRKQKATGKTNDGISFPLCLLITQHENMSNSGDSGVNPNRYLFSITVWVFQNLSGLVVLDENGFVESCNHHFALLMFGYTQGKILNMHITKLIPNFGHELQCMERRSRNLTNTSPDNDKTDTETDPVLNDVKLPTPVSEAKSIINDLITVQVELPARKNSKANAENDKNMPNVNIDQQNCDRMQTLTIESIRESDANISTDDVPTPVNSGDYSIATKCANFVTSTPLAGKPLSSTIPSKIPQYTEGKYKGEAFHADDNIIDIMYTISTQDLSCARKIYCVWICRDPDTVYDHDEEKQLNLTLTFNSITSTVDHSLGQAIKITAAQNTSRPNSVSLISQCEDEQVSGDFNKHYTTLKQIGKGAYGYVKMAYRNSDRLLVVAKFILKEKLCPQFMILNEEKKEVPMEVYLLTTVKHPNIVTIFDVFENEKFFQLVMEKHGSGMDLFEFIDRRPLIDEKLGSYIFRQIANAVSYLHDLNILHRDIKDENIIIDQNFHVKLIDFGSATFMVEGKLFSTFFGTTEYCSPEVLAGNKYAGPELEMWSLGVTLYVLMFFENPFIDVEETLKSDLIIPHKVSCSLQSLLFSMLDKDPLRRCTMKQLMADSWINQEINPSTFNFAWIVPCETHEANPEKYFSGQMYSSTTALSTTSPQDSLSLVDEDSIIDNDEEECLGKSNSNSQYNQPCDICGNRAELSETTPRENFSEYSQPQEDITVNQNITKQFVSHVPVGPSTKPSISVTEICTTGTATIFKKHVNKNSPPSSKCLLNEVNICACPKASTSTGMHSYRTSDNVGSPLYTNINLSKIKKHTSSNSLSKMNVSDFSLDYDRSTASLLFASNSQSCRSNDNSTSTKPSHRLLQIEDISNQLSSSKSENNIFDQKTDSKFAVYDVVSLNDLNTEDPFPNCIMNDLSKTKILNKISDGQIDSKYKP